MQKEGKHRKATCMRELPRGAKNRGAVVSQPRGAHKTPGKEKEKGMTGSVKAQRDQGDIKEKEDQESLCKPGDCVSESTLMKEK